MSNYKLIQKPLVIDGNFLSGLRQQVINYPDVTFVINYRNTKDISLVDMRNIESISILGNVGKIGSNAFSNCDNLKVFIYNGTTIPTIENEIFQNQFLCYFQFFSMKKRKRNSQTKLINTRK